MAAAPAHLHLEGMQTAVPTRVVEPGRSRRIAVAPTPLAAVELQRRFRAVLYYVDAPGAGADEAARARWEEAAWVKESLSVALADHPEMAGRLRRHGDGSWEVKFNDTGVRFLQASVEVSMEEFLEAKDRAQKEAALSLWTAVDAEDPDMSALCFLQLTRFQGDGYAIGISCSLLLSDPLSLIKFLKSWARTHAQMQAQNKLATHPMMQYTRYFQRPATPRRLKSIPLDSFADSGDTTTVLYRATNVPDHRALAMACIDQGSEKLGPRFSVFAGDGSGGLSIETCTRDGRTVSGPVLEAAQWHEAGLEELVLKESKPVHVSYSVVPCVDEGLVVVMPGDGELLISATVPK